MASTVRWPLGAEPGLSRDVETEAVTTEAFGRLYDQYRQLVRGIVLAHVVPGDAPDLEQEVFATALQRLADLRSRDAFGPWISAIARNRARDHLRRERPAQPLPELPTSDPIDARLDAIRILERIQRLPEAYREPQVLRLVEGLSGPAIAKLTGLTPGSVRVNLYRGLAMLRKEIER